MKNIGYYNGETGLLEELKVPFLDRVCFYGDGVYDATMALDGVVVFVEDHIERFFNSCANMAIDPGIGKDELAELLASLVAQVDGSYHFVYWQVTRGTAHRSHPFPEGPANLWVMVEPEEKQLRPSAVSLVTVEDTRFLHCNTKTLNLLPNVMAAQHAKASGCEEAVFVRDGFVTECAHSNVHILKEGALVTHPADNLILPGIARKHIIAACGKLGVPVVERPFTKQELMDADEVIVSASSEPGGVLAKTVDGVSVGGHAGELFSLIRDVAVREFESYVEARRA